MTDLEKVEELKACPFCGSKPTKHRKWENYEGNHTKECFLYSVLGNIPEKLEEAWNRRIEE